MNAARRPIPGTAQFVALHQRIPAATCWASCEPDALSREHDARAFLVLPGAHDPATYVWPVAGREIVLVGTGASDRRILATCRVLLRSGALKIAIVHGNDRRMPRLSIVAAKALRRAA